MAHAMTEHGGATSVVVPRNDAGGPDVQPS